MKFLRLFLIFLVTITFLTCHTIASAADSFQITNFQSDIILQKNGQLAVSENITALFSTQKHGIYRDIPYVYKNDRGQKIYTDIQVQKILRDSIDEEFIKTQNSENIRLKIGNAGVVLTGHHIYTIVYNVIGVLRSFPDHDELYWNVTGNNWETTIDKASSTILLPKASLKQTLCYEGVLGARNECKSTEVSKKKATFSSLSPLAPGEGMTVVIGYEKGIVPILAVAPPEPFPFLKPQYLIELLGVFLLGVSVSIFIWFRYGRDAWYESTSLNTNDKKITNKTLGLKESIVVEYEPPKKLRPAQIGVLMDERADTRDVTATIIDLAQRGYFTITELPAKWLFGKTDYRLDKKDKTDTNLLSYEKELLQKLFDSKKSIKVSELKTTFYEDLQKVKKLLYQDAMDNNFFLGNPENVRTKFFVIGVLFTAAMVFFTIKLIQTQNYHLIMFCAGLAVSGVVLMIVSRSMARRSAYGRELYQRSLGYELFLTSVEQYKQKYFEKKNILNDILPYTIVFGLTQKFAKALQDIGIKPPQPTWYYGATPFNMVTFGTRIDDFSNSLSSAIATSPKGSGFSGGGGSGGGFGGGGGGSW